MNTMNVLSSPFALSLPRVRTSFAHNLRCTSTGISRRCQSTHQSVGAYTRESQRAPTTSEELPPHSLMPTNMLVRAALVSTISSKPWLLKLALNVLTFLTKTRISFLQVSKNPVIHGVLKQTFYNHFCAGENPAEVTNTIRNLKDIGFKGVILTYAREIVVDANLTEKGKGTLDAESGKGDLEETHSPDIDTWKNGVLETVRLLGGTDFLALKLTGAGASVMLSLSSNKPLPKQMSQALEEVCTEAIKRNVKILVDAEQISVQKGIDTVALDLMRKYNSTTDATVYNTYQVYLKSTPDTLRAHMRLAASADFTLGIKLVRGAYIASEPRHLINDTKLDTDNSYNGIAESLLKQTYNAFPTGDSSPATTTVKEEESSSSSSSFPSTALFLATHNKDSALQAHSLHTSRLQTNQRTLPRIQYGQLLGMADEVSCSLLQMGRRESQSITTTPAADRDSPVAAGSGGSGSGSGPEVYKCLSWGPLEDCLSYLLRRARENQDAVARSKGEYRATWAEVWRRVRAKMALSR